MGKNYTVEELKTFKDRRERGLILFPGQARALKEWEEKNVSTGLNSDGSGSGSNDLREQGGAEEGTASGLSGSGETGGHHSGGGATPAAGSQGSGTAAPLDAAAVVEHVEKNSSPAAKKLPPPPKPGKGGRPAAVSAVGPSQEEINRQKCRIAGYQTADMLILTGVTFMGPEWNYLDPVLKDGKVVYDERQTLRDAYADMFEAYGWSSVPPWYGVVAATGSYVVVRLKMPETKKKFQGWLPKAWAKVKSWFTRKPVPPPPIEEKKS